MNSDKSLIQITEDGSQTLVSPIFKERYHSIHGAKSESDVVFINAGLIDKFAEDNLKVLELGFGTGLNAILTWQFADLHQKTIQYIGYEKFPVKKEFFTKLDYSNFVNPHINIQNLHELEWNTQHQISTFFNFTKIHDDIINVSNNYEYDVIFFDAFAPNAQEELWTVDIFKKMYDITKKNGVLVTYCAKGQVKRNMKQAGYIIEPLPGPSGKREMTRARKI